MESSLAQAQAALDEGHARQAAGDLDAAERAFARAAELAPRAPQPVHNLGVVAQLRGDWPAAEAHFRHALGLEPGRAVTRASLGVALLGQGRYAEGFPLADAWRELPERQAKAAPTNLPYPSWRGEDLAGKRLLVWGEEGFGDQIMHARFAALLRDRGAHITWVCPPPLARLFRKGLGVDVIAAEGAVDLGDHDYLCPSSSLPAILMPGLGAPPSAPYLALPPPRPIPGAARIGVVAKGNPKHPGDRHRSLPDDQAARLEALPGAISLLPEATGAKDFHETAEIIAGLDLVISVDTAAAHLAGALGKPVWVLMFEPVVDWRWLQGRADSPWYPSARVMRQPAPGDWAGVIEEIVRKTPPP